jgi:PAS domain S-box-containing protein
MMPDCAITGDDQRIAFPVGTDGKYPSLWGHALNTGKPFYTNSPSKHAKSSGLPEGHVPLKNYMSIPAVVHGEVVGQISLANTPDGYTDTHMVNVKRLADLFGIAVQRKRAEEALRSSEMLYRSLVESTRAVAWELDLASKKFTYVSPQVEEITGYAPEKWTDLDFWAGILYQDDRDYAISYCETETSKGKDHEFEYRILAADGRILWIKDIVSLVKENGRPVTLRGYLLDITERKQAEETLRLTQFTVDHSAEAAYWMGPDARFTYVNDQACRSLGYSREELLTMTVHDVDPDFPKEVWPDHWREVREKGSFAIESNHQTKDGRIFPVEITVNHIVFEGQEYNCAYAKDISEHKTAENERVRLESAIEQSSEAIMLLDLENKLEYVNPAFENMTGYHRDEVMGKYPYLLDSGLQEPEFYQHSIWLKQ